MMTRFQSFFFVEEKKKISVAKISDTPIPRRVSWHRLGGFAAFAFCFLVLLLNWTTMTETMAHEPIKSWSDWGGFGDGFGGTNAVISLIGLAALIYTLNLQRQSNNAQQESLEQYEQTVVLSSKTALLTAYCQHLQWFLEETARRKDNRPTMSEKEFDFFSRQARLTSDKHWKIIREMEAIITVKTDKYHQEENRLNDDDDE